MSKVVEYPFLKQGQKANTCYRKIGNRMGDSTLACGYMRKDSDADSNKDMSLSCYGGLLLLSGEGFYSDGMGRQKLTRGTFVQRLPGHIHSTLVTPDSGWVEFFICINASTYQNLFDMGLMSASPVLKGKVPTEIIDSFPSFLARMQAAGDGELTPLYFEAQQLLCRINSFCAEEHIDGSAIKECIRLLDYSLGRMQGGEIAGRIGIPYETLRKSFSAVMGISLGKYAILTRISLVKEELISSNLSLGQIAAKFGYADYFTFCKQFKQYAYVTPREFRESRGIPFTRG